jgi:stress response protein SCP2
VDAAFYNRVVAADGALHHSGDSTPEESGVSVNESIDVDVDQLPWSVAGVVFVADAYAGGTLGDVKSATTLVQTADGDGGHDTPFKTNVDFGGRSVGTDAKGVVLAVLHRNPEDVNEWLLKKVGTMCAGPLAHTFEGCLEEARDAVAKKREEREEDVKCSQ